MNIFQNKNFLIILVKILVIVLAIGAILFAIKLFPYPVGRYTKAANANPKIFFNKTELRLNNNEGVIRLGINSGDKKIGFAKFTLNFDPNKIQLAQVQPVKPFFNIINLHNQYIDPTLSDTITTPLEAANAQGKYTTILVVPPEDNLPGPSSSFIELAKLKIKKISTSPNDITILHIDPALSQLADINLVTYSNTTLNTESIKLILNYTLAVTITPTSGVVSMNCNSWTDFFINECTLAAYSNGNSDPRCKTLIPRVTIHLSKPEAAQMRFIQPSRETWCNTIANNDARWSEWVAYSPTKTYLLKEKGDIKVCAQFKNELIMGIPCGAVIRYE